MAGFTKRHMRRSTWAAAVALLAVGTSAVVLVSMSGGNKAQPLHLAGAVTNFAANTNANANAGTSAISGGDSATAHYFGLEINGVTQEYLGAISALSNQPLSVHREINGVPENPPLVLNYQLTVTRGENQSQAVTDLASTGCTRLTNAVSIVVLDYEGSEVARYNLSGACVAIVTNSTNGSEEKLTFGFQQLTYGG